MNSINDVTILGICCSNPIEIKVKSEEENYTVKMKVVTNKKYFSNKYNDYITTSEKHSIKLWKANAKFALENIKIGDIIAVTGELHYHIVKDENNMEISKKTEIIANRVIKINNNSKFKEE